jgi:hypothetical protein
MNQPILPSGIEEKARGFWTRPEGKMAMALWALAIGLFIWFWGSVVGFLLSAAVDTLHLIVVLAAIVLLLWFLTSKKVHYIGRSIARRLTSIFVDMDPIGIRKTYLEDTRKKKKELDDSVGVIRGLRIGLKRRIDENQVAYDISMRQCATAQSILDDACSTEERKHQAQRTLSSESRHSDNLAALLSRQRDHLKQNDFVISVLSRYGEVCDDTILDLSREIQLQEQEREESLAFRKGMRSAFGILRGFGDGQEMDSMASETIKRQYADRLGEVENALELTKDFISRADMNDEASVAGIQAKLEAWKGQNSTLSLGKAGNKQELIQSAASEVEVPIERKTR